MHDPMRQEKFPRASPPLRPRAQLGHGGAGRGVRSVDVRSGVARSISITRCAASLEDQVGAVLGRQPGSILAASLAKVLEQRSEVSRVVAPISAPILQMVAVQWRTWCHTLTKYS